ncbi:MAG: hypothetical protein IT304_10805 [Dehalococcoidia bacterium]|nr:hypothetical protein [Dehalococcoidia bacterium]
MVAGVTLIVSGCAGGGPVTADRPSPTPTAAPTLRVDLQAAEPARVGAPIATGAGAVSLPMYGDGGIVQPVAAVGPRLLLSETPTAEGGGGRRFFAWDPLTGEREALWEAPAGRQDIVTAVSGSRVVVVRTGLALPFADWLLTVRDLATSRMIPVAMSQAGVAAVTGATAAPPLGLAPYAAIDGNVVCWAAYSLDPAGRLRRQVLLHDLETGSTRVLAEADPRTGHGLESPSLGGGLAAWIETAPGGSVFAVAELGTGQVTRYAAPGSPSFLRLDGSGRHLAWDDGLAAKYALDLDDGSLVRYAGAEGWGVLAAGHRLSWAPAGAFSGTGGFYDLATGEVRFLEPSAAGSVTNLAGVFGGWFVWQEIPAGANGRPRAEAGVYHLLPLDP